MSDGDFVLVSRLTENITNRKINVDKDKVEWLQMRWIRVDKDKPYQFMYRYVLCIVSVALCFYTHFHELFLFNPGILITH